MTANLIGIGAYAWTGLKTRWRPTCAWVILLDLPHQWQENSPYSICTKQISEAVQFIKANYQHKVLEVISTRRALHSLRHWPLALLWIRVLAAHWHKRPHSGARNWVVWLFDTTQHDPGSRCTDSAAMLLRDADFRSSGSKWMTFWAEYWWARCQGRQSC